MIDERLAGSVALSNMRAQLAMAGRTSSLAARLVSLLTLVALLVTPACGPLCATKNCAGAPASQPKEDHCHLAMMDQQYAAHWQGVASCGTRELPATILSSAISMNSAASQPADNSNSGAHFFSPARFSAQPEHQSGHCSVTQLLSVSTRSPYIDALRI